MPIHGVHVDAGMIAVSAGHSAPAGIAAGSPCPRHAPALLAQYNAAARAYRCTCRGLVGVVPDMPADFVLSICIGNSGDQHVRHHHTKSPVRRTEA